MIGKHAASGLMVPAPSGADTDCVEHRRQGRRQLIVVIVETTASGEGGSSV